jgi:glucose-6-phosphate 1-dehydrogenase
LTEAVAVASNPLAEGLERLPVAATTMVIFGATGDLSRRKLLPALYNLAHEGALPERFQMVGVARDEASDEDYRSVAHAAVREHSRRVPDDSVLERFLESVRYVPGDFDDPVLYSRLAEACQRLDSEAGRPLNRCFYLSTAPAFFPVIIEALGEHGLQVREGAEARVVIEKPIGASLSDAQELTRRVLAVFEERQIFRIDHYLGKETVQNLLALRFANQLFEPVWNRNYVDHVQITAAEDLGVASRAGYYDRAGALRDLVQNHLLQLVTLLCMEPPVHFTADEVRDEKVKVLRAIKRPEESRVDEVAVRARYGPGTVGGTAVPGYVEEREVAADSTTETYAALRLEVDNWRWAGVPMYLRTGKRLARRVTEIAVVLEAVPHLGFTEGGSLGVGPNTIVLTVQPNEGVAVSLAAKIPGTRMAMRPVSLEFLYGTAFLSQSPEAYERLILDALRGDATLFARGDEVQAQWSIVDPILAAWAERTDPPPSYAAGSQGPAEAGNIMLAGHRWRDI